MKKKPLELIGWREWAELPDLGVSAVKVKVDTGARSSSLHAFDIEQFRRRGKSYVRFGIHPMQRNSKETVWAEAPLLEERWVKSSNGQRQLRPVIETTLKLVSAEWPIELTLASRDLMGFRMLLGREAVRGLYAVDPGHSFLQSKRPTTGHRRKKKARAKT